MNCSKEKILWGILIFIAAVEVVDIITGGFWRSSLIKVSLVSLLMFGPPILSLVLHSAWALGYLRGLIFILIVSLTGLAFEILGVKYGAVFGSHYVYRDGGLALCGVPLVVPLYWAVFIYTGYTVVSSFLLWANKEKPSKQKGDAVLLPLLILFDALVVVAIDLFIDPLQVAAGRWAWPGGGPYFGVPIGNFVGWFIVVLISTGIFRVFEYFAPQRPIKIDRSVFLTPVIGYGLICLTCFPAAIRAQLPGLALVGVFTMLPVVVANLILFTVWRRGRKIRGEGSK